MRYVSHRTVRRSWVVQVARRTTEAFPMIRTNVIILVALLLAGTAFAYNGQHGCFGPTARPEQIPLTELKPQPQEATTGAAAKRWRYVLPGDRATQLLVTYEAGLFFAELTVEGKPVLKERTPFSDFGPLGDPPVYSGDFNGDNKPDFMVVTTSGGCGLASGEANVGFVLSAGGSYRLVAISTLFPDPTNFVILNGERCFTQTSFFMVQRCGDRKQHGFWIYNLLRFSKDGVTVDNSVEPGFPRTIWYSFRPNQSETTLLGSDTKLQLQKSALAEMFWTQSVTPR